MASPITFSGLASGIDTASLIDALVQVASVPITNLKTDKSNNSSQSSKLSDIKTKLSTLQTAAEALDHKSEALGNKTSSSAEGVLTATASGGAAMGSYKLEVTSLAVAERTYSDEFTGTADDVGLFGSGTLTVQVGSGTAVSIDVTASDTLSSVAKKINASGAQVSAGVFKDGNGHVRLQVTGTQAGEANGITFTEAPGLTLGLDDPLNEKQPATDAVVTIDGLEVKSPTNAVTGAVPGVTLNLVDKGTATVKVDRDGDALKTKLDSFVKAYNDVMNTLNAAFTYDGVTKGADTLSGDSTMKQLQMQLRTMVGKLVPNGDSSMQMLSSIGITSQRDGTLMLDSTKLTSAVGKDYEGIASMLGGLTDGSGLMADIASGIKGYTQTGGTIQIKINNIATRNHAIDDQISSLQDRMDKYRSVLENKYAAMEQTISGLQSQGNSLLSILSRSSG